MKLYDISNEKTTIEETDYFYGIESPYGAEDDFKVSSANLRKRMGQYQDRGDFTAIDWQGTFTEDGNWHDLDCSAIVPAGAKVIIFRGYGQANAAEAIFRMKKKGASPTSQNYAQVFTQVANFPVAIDFRVPCSTARLVQYQCSGTWATGGGPLLWVAGWEF